MHLIFLNVIDFAEDKTNYLKKLQELEIYYQNTIRKSKIIYNYKIDHEKFINFFIEEAKKY